MTKLIKHIIAGMYRRDHVSSLLPRTAKLLWGIPAILLIIFSFNALAQTETLDPNAAGDFSAWTVFPAGTDFGVTSDADDATYIFTLTQDDKDVMNLTNSTGSGTINSVTIWARVQVFNGGGAAEQGNTYIKTNGVFYTGLATYNFDDEPAWGDFSEVYATNPQTGSAWTWAEVDALQAGITSTKHDADEEMRCTKIWVVVDYTVVTCSDGILNQNEVCIDKGGTCGADPSCTELSPGDIAIVGMNATNPDEFTFVVLTDIASGTTISFTDNGWKSDNTFRTGEGTLIWTATSAITCGTEITVLDLVNPFSVDIGTITDDGSFNLAETGDQILAYQGSSTNPIFIAALDQNSAVGWDADAIDAQTSAVPQGLTDGTNCIGVTPNADVKYDCPNGGAIVSGTAADLLAAICTDANWVGQSGRYTLPVPCSFTCGGCVEPGTAPDAPTYASITTTSFDINWANGGPNYLVVVRSGSAVTANPVDGTTYTASTTFGSGTDIGTSEYVVYDGSGTTVSITGLTCGTTYYVEIFSHDCVAGSEDYKTDVGGTSSQATSACPPGTCFDNIKNGTETGVDCGGPCPDCECE